MPIIEIVTPSQRGELIRTDTTLALVEGLRTLVRGGITGYFDDVLWTQYVGPSGIVDVENHPDFQRLLSRLGDREVGPSGRSLPLDTNVLPLTRDLVGNMAAQRAVNSKSTTGDGFYTIAALERQRFIAAPAHHLPDTPEHERAEIDVDLEHGICFGGISLLSAMLEDGFDPETISNREGQPRVYREKQIGEFFVSHTLE